MAFYNKYPNRKDWRDTSNISVSSSCEQHGGCPWCLGNRMYRKHKEEGRCNDSLREYIGTSGGWRIGTEGPEATCTTSK